MSAIHEALKKARNARKVQDPPLADVPASVPVIEVRQRPAANTAAWIVAVGMIGIAAFSWQYARASRLEKKLTQALLELNDTRGNYLTVKKKKIEDEGKLSMSLEFLREKVRHAEEERNRAWLQKQAVEVENLQKEKKISEITKQKHELEMTRWKLKEEIDSLKKEMAPLPANTER